jgi:4-hydroxybenzoate polyprenyltransferase
VKSFIRFLVFSNIWVAFCVLAFALSSELLLETANHQISKFVFFATVFTYNFQRVVRIWNGANHMRKDWLLKYRVTIYSLILFGGIMSGYYFFHFQILTQLLIVFSGIISLLYPFGLRKIPFSKIFVISFVWTISTMLLLVLENNILITQNVVLHLVSRFLFVFAITIPFDIRDLKYDTQNLQTIPLFFGTKKARFMAVISVFICAIIAILQYFENTLISSNLLALILLYFVSSIFIVKSDENKSEMYFSFWIESLSILAYLLLIISGLIF